MSEHAPAAGNAFGRLMSEFRGGRSLTDLAEALQQCVAAVKDTGKPAVLRYSMTITPTGNAVSVTDKVEVKLPAPEREQSIFFPTGENTLSRKDPAQRELELRELAPPRVEAREVIPVRAERMAVGV